MSAAPPTPETVLAAEASHQTEATTSSEEPARRKPFSFRVLASVVLAAKRFQGAPPDLSAALRAPLASSRRRAAPRRAPPPPARPRTRGSPRLPPSASARSRDQPHLRVRHQQAAEGLPARHLRARRGRPEAHACPLAAHPLHGDGRGDARERQALCDLAPRQPRLAADGAPPGRDADRLLGAAGGAVVERRARKICARKPPLNPQPKFFHSPEAAPRSDVRTSAPIPASRSCNVTSSDFAPRRGHQASTSAAVAAAAAAAAAPRRGAPETGAARAVYRARASGETSAAPSVAPGADPLRKASTSAARPAGSWKGRPCRRRVGLGWVWRVWEGEGGARSGAGGSSGAHCTATERRIVHTGDSRARRRAPGRATPRARYLRLRRPSPRARPRPARR
jgi:hypothetical protein